MIVLPRHHFETLKRNGGRYAEAKCDLVPVVKFHDPGGTAKWLITRIDPRDDNILYGLHDLGIGLPIIGPVLFSELEEVEGRLGIGLERDIFFCASHPISVYAHAAQILSRITEDADRLARSAVALGLDAAPHLPIPGKTPCQ
jgi:hypothetical protein